jgi:hypothetical protein
MHARYRDSMRRLTLRIDESLAHRLKSVAASRGTSVNGFATSILAAAVDPGLPGDELGSLRERLSRAGLLERSIPSDRVGPTDREFEEARAAAGRATMISDLVSEGRR